MIIPNIWENKKCSKPPTRWHQLTHIFLIPASHNELPRSASSTVKRFLAMHWQKRCLDSTPSENMARKCGIPLSCCWSLLRFILTCELVRYTGRPQVLKDFEAKTLFNIEWQSVGISLVERMHTYKNHWSTKVLNWENHPNKNNLKVIWDNLHFVRRFPRDRHAKKNDTFVGKSLRRRMKTPYLHINSHGWCFEKNDQLRTLKNHVYRSPDAQSLCIP